MSKKLKKEELDSIPEWSHDKLLDQVEYFSKWKTLIETQNANGIAHKDDADPDVVKLKSDYEAVKTALVSRLKNQTQKNLLAKVEKGSNQIALISASNAGALGIPIHGNTPSQITNIKIQYKSNREKLVTAIGM